MFLSKSLSTQTLNYSFKLTYNIYIYILPPVEASRHRVHYSCQVDAPPQLKMVPDSINLQNISGQEVRTHPPMVMLAFISNILFILSWVPLFWVRTLTFFHCVRTFYSIRSFVPLNCGKTFWLVMMVLRWWQSHHCPAGGCQKLWEGWLVVIPVFSLCRRWGVGCDRLPEVTQEGPVEHAFSRQWWPTFCGQDFWLRR